MLKECLLFSLRNYIIFFFLILEINTYFRIKMKYYQEIKLFLRVMPLVLMVTLDDNHRVV